MGHGWKIINRGGKVFDQVVHDPLHRKNSRRSTQLVHDRQTSVAALCHQGDGFADGVASMQHNRVGGHRLLEWDIEACPGGHHLEHIPLRKNANHNLLVTDQHCAPIVVLHLPKCVPHGVGGSKAQRFNRIAPVHCFRVEI